MGCSPNEVNPFEDFQHVDSDDVINPNSDYIIVIGDIQEYTGSPDFLPYLVYSLDWIRCQNTYFKNIKCVLQDGDVTWSNDKHEWDIANNAFMHLCDSILLIPCTGNHDYNWGGEIDMEIKDRNSTGINNYLSLPILDKRTIKAFEKGKRENIIVPVEINNSLLYVISLEFGPRKEAVEWARQIVAQNPNEKYILMTHEWLTTAGNRIAKNSYAEKQFLNLDYSTPQEIWEKLVYPNDNILCVICGHNGFCKYIFSKNQAGREVCQILFNLQYQTNGGDGMIQLWEFPSNENVINISVYNTITREYHPDSSTQIQIQL